jgi:hypothetical protein
VGEMTCPNEECGHAILIGDHFCEVCGTPVTEQPRAEAFTGNAAPVGSTNGSVSSNGRAGGGTGISSPPLGGGVIGSQSTTPPEEPAGTPFFSHERPRPPGPLSSVTRLLCAAAYLDYGFANRVILNLLITRRAVAPSVNIDVGPVLRHCLRARRHILIRDVVLVLIMLTGLVIKTLPTVDVLLYTVALGGALPNVRRGHGGFWTHLFLLAVTVITGALAVVFTVTLALGSVVSSVFSTGISTVSAMTGLTSLVITFAVLFGALGTTEFVFLRTTARALTGESPLRTEPDRSLPPIAQHRMAVVEGAQWGNVTLHGGFFPFIGAGVQTEAHWSIATPLRPAADHQGWGGYVRIDPVDLQQFIGDRLRALNDPALPINERIAALTVSDRLVGTGWMPAGDPLLDEVHKTPYSHASHDAVEALIRHPQARLRYYQQVTVNDESQAVMSHGRKVIDGVDQQLSVSAFVYAAVEGRMLYLQFVLTALPPIDSKYLVGRITYASSVPGTLVFAFRRLFPSVMSAPPGICSAVRLWRKEQKLQKLSLMVQGSDYGARISVRELGTADDFSRYMQVLDVEKYNMIFSQTLLNSVTEYLTKNGIEISAFTGIAQNIINNINNGTVYGDVNQQGGNNNSINKPPNPNSGS